MLATTTLDSRTSTSNPARIAEMAQARPHGPAPTMIRSLVNDLVASRANAHVRHASLRQLLQPVEILASGFRQCVDLPAVGGRRVPAIEPLVDRLTSV